MIIPAGYKGEVGWLHAELIVGTWVYAVTMDEANATDFRTPEIARRHAERAARAGLTTPKWADR